MNETGYKITDWIFFFSKEEKEKISNLLINTDDIKLDISKLSREFITWKLITVYLPIFTFLITFFINLFTTHCWITNIYNFFNNGSIPIISFGLITSGMPYIMEQLEKDQIHYQLIRRRVMAIAVIFMFLTSILYILQTLEVVSDSYNSQSKILITLLSICGLLFSLSIGFKMFLLQTNIIDDYELKIKKGVNSLKDSLNDLP